MESINNNKTYYSTTLYKRNSNGTINFWTVIADNGIYWTEYGQLGGTKVSTTPIKAIAKNIGKKNETTKEAQAIKEAISLVQLKKKSNNFVDNIEDVDKKSFEEPMLAKKYDGSFNPKIHKFIQPKLDGIRMNVSLVNGNVTAISRKNNAFYTVDHIKNELKDFLQCHPTLHLDGELYNHVLHDDFNEIVSLVKKEKITDIDLKKIINTVQYHVYDCFDDSHKEITFSERYNILTELNNLEYTKLVPTYSISSKIELDKLFLFFLSEGYEGAIIRADKPYEHKRSNNLLKYKNFLDSEFKVIDIHEGNGNWSGVAGYVTIELNDGSTCRSNIKGNKTYCKELLENKEKYIGKFATVCYFGITKDGKLRFPYLKSFRIYE